MNNIIANNNTSNNINSIEQTYNNYYPGIRRLSVLSYQPTCTYLEELQRDAEAVQTLISLTKRQKRSESFDQLPTITETKVANHNNEQMKANPENIITRLHNSP